MIEGESSIENFDVGVTLGTGSFGRVRIATHLPSKCTYAIKMLKKTEVIRFQQVQHMLSEKDILWELSKEPHPFIVTLATKSKCEIKNSRAFTSILCLFCHSCFKPF